MDSRLLKIAISVFTNATYGAMALALLIYLAKRTELIMQSVAV